MLAVLVVNSRSVVVRRREQRGPLLLDELEQELDGGAAEGDSARLREAVPVRPGVEVGRGLAAELLATGAPVGVLLVDVFVVMDPGDMDEDQLAPTVAGELLGEAGGVLAVRLEVGGEQDRSTERRGRELRRHDDGGQRQAAQQLAHDGPEVDESSLAAASASPEDQRARGGLDLRQPLEDRPGRPDPDPGEGLRVAAGAEPLVDHDLRPLQLPVAQRVVVARGDDVHRLDLVGAERRPQPRAEDQRAVALVGEVEAEDEGSMTAHPACHSLGGRASGRKKCITPGRPWAHRR